MTEIEWIDVFLETQPKGKKKPIRVIKGVAKIDNKNYYLEYVLFSGFEWWAANLITSEQIVTKNTSFSESPIYYNSKENKFYSFENLPKKIKLFVTNEI